MGSGVASILPLYKVKKIDNFTKIDYQALHNAKRFLDDVLNGQKMLEEYNSTLPDDPLAASRAFEVVLHVFISYSESFPEDIKALKEKFIAYREIIENVIAKKPTPKKQEKKIEDTINFFSKLGGFSRAKNYLEFSSEKFEY
jgi:hypothetical protein